MKNILKPFLLVAFAANAPVYAAVSIPTVAVSLADFGVTPGTTVWGSAKLQKAIDAASSAGKRLDIPAGEYLLAPDDLFDDEDKGYATYCATNLRSNTHIRAAKGAVFKVANNQSTDSAPKSMGVFCTNQVLQNVSIVGLTIDMNGARNKISPSRPSEYSRFNQSAVLVSGTPGGVAAAMSDVLLEDNVFKNNPGVSTICMAQSNARGIRLGKRWTLRRNTFLNNGLDTDDQSVVFGWADDVIVDGNTFANDRPFGSAGKTGINTGYEVHGSNHRLTNNKFKNAMRGIWVSSNYSTAVRGTVISNNTFDTLFYGVDFFRTIPALTPIYDTQITGNVFRFDDTRVPAVPRLDFKAGVQVASEYAQQQITVKKNQFFKKGTSLASAALVVTPGVVPGQMHDQIVFEDNEGEGVTFGTFIRTSPVNGLGDISAKYNHWRSLTPAGAYDISSGDAVLFTGSPKQIRMLDLGGGSCTDARSVPQTTYCMTLTGDVSNLSLSPSKSSGMKRKAFIEDGLNVRSRKGSF